MKVKRLLFVLMLLSSLAKAQYGPKEFGDVSLEELALKKYDKDTSAAALVLFEKGYLEVDHFSTRGWVLKTHVRIKILRQSAVEEWGSAKFRIPRNGLKDLAGASFNLENGEIVRSELNKSSIFKSSYNKSVDNISFALPNVKEGSVIEFTFTQRYGSLYLPSWQFQNTIPTLYSEYSFLCSANDIVPHIRGPYEIIQEEVKYEGNYQKWVLKDVPAFRAEPMMPDKKAYLAAIEFSFKSSSWEKVFLRFRLNESLAEMVYGTKHHYLKKKAEAITEGITTPGEKVKAISDYIKQNIGWNGVQDYLADDPRQVLKKGTGTSGDINLLLASLLKKAGFDVNLILLSTRDNGHISEDYPWHGHFNYVICELTIQGERLLLDATEKYLPYDMLPARCLNHKGFLVGKEQYGWVSLEPKRHDKKSLEAAVTLSETGEMQGELVFVMSDYAAFKFREKTLHAGGAEEEAYVNEVLKGPGNIRLLEKQNIQDPEKPVIEKYKWESSQYVTATADRLYFNPHIFLREEQNPFKIPERLYPVDFNFLEEKMVITKIQIPEGFVVEELPESAAFALPGKDVKFVCNFSHVGNELTIMNMLQVNKSLFQPVEYLALKELYDILIEKQSENVVLRRR